MTEAAAAPHHDPYCEYLHANVVEAGPERAVVAQPNLDELNNHVAVRHAGALYTAGYTASKRLVLAALGDLADTARLQPLTSDVEYTNFPSGDITSTARPSGPGWDSVRDELEAGGEPELATHVVAANEAGKPVVSAQIAWRVSRRR
jgi:hypothetical protein